MKYFIVAGESSGDLYGSLLMEALLHYDELAEFQYWGGPKMKATRPLQLKSIEDTAFMGFWEVAKNIGVIRGFFKEIKKSILEYNPDLIIFIDYPGFNLRMATWAKKQNFKTTYYISPQLWAWKKNRFKILRDSIDQFFVILPFEQEFYSNLDTPYIYHGHPLLEIIPKPSSSSTKQKGLTIGLFPGSRIQEVKKHMPYLLAFAETRLDAEFVIAGVKHIKVKEYLPSNQNHSNVTIVYEQTYELMRTIDYAISSSGTATLELALHEVPQIVIYKTSQLSYQIGKRLINTRYISLVNLIARKKVVPELIQNQLTLENIINAFDSIQEPLNRESTLASYRALRKDLGNGQTSQKVAQDIFGLLKNENSTSS